MAKEVEFVIVKVTDDYEMIVKRMDTGDEELVAWPKDGDGVFVRSQARVREYLQTYFKAKITEELHMENAKMREPTLDRLRDLEGRTFTVRGGNRRADVKFRLRRVEIE